MKEKFVIWGLPLHSHTHSYVHHAFAKAASYMGFEVAWVEDDIKSNHVMTNNAVVLCCGVAEQNLKYTPGVNYILHNSSRDELRQGNYINLQVYTHDVLSRNTTTVSVEELSFWEESTRTLYQPWATDLLPPEIDKISPSLVKSAEKRVTWVGSIMNGDQGNYEEILSYAQACEKRGFEFAHTRLVSVEDNIDAIRSSRHAPTIQGKWQVEKGYIPCRLFKNISYGCWTETNSDTSASLLGIVSRNTMEELFEHSERFFRNPSKDIIRDKMNLVRDKHTYVNRIRNIFQCLELPCSQS